MKVKSSLLVVLLRGGVYHFDQCGSTLVFSTVQCESKKYPLCGFLEFFPKRLGIL